MTILFDLKGLKETIRETIGPLIKGQKSIALFDFPNHSNVGDSAIWLGTIDYLKENFSTIPIVWMSDKISINENSLPLFDKSTVLIIHGGGNFGDLWKEHQDHRELIIENYPNNRIIQLPQSIHFQSASNFEKTKHVVSKHQDLYLLVRDLKSLEIAKKFLNVKAFLCPDMAFYIKNIPIHRIPVHNIVSLIRTDKESVISGGHRGYEIPSFDWLDEPATVAVRIDLFLAQHPSIQKNSPVIYHAIRKLVYKQLAEERFKRGCNLLMQGKVVITDRLHAHIMCTLLGIPSVVLDNSYGKIKNILETWEVDSEKTYQTKSFDTAVALAKKLHDSVSSHTQARPL